MKTFLIAITAFFAVHLYGALDTITLSGLPTTIGEGETKVLELPDSLFVHKVFIQAVGVGSQDSYAELSANGDVKGTLYLPGHDPHYTITVEDRTRSLEMTVVRGRMRLIAIQAVVSDSGFPEPLPSASHTKLGKLSEEAIWIEGRLEDYTSYENYGVYLLPIKKSAARAYAIAEAQGDGSGSARPYYEQFLAALDHAAPFLNHTFEVHEAFHLAVRMLSVTERVRVLLK